MRAFLVAVFLAAPAWAEPVAGLADPAFRLPFERALQGDDPAALADLHAAAEAGNMAARMALPTVLIWMPPTGTLAERNRYRRLGGVPLAEAVAAAHPVAALWAGGEAGQDMAALLSRALGLYAVGEDERATALFLNWLGPTGGHGDLPPGFFDQPVPPHIMAQVLRGRLANPDRSPAEATDALLADRVRADDPAAWIALAGFAGLHATGTPPPDTARLARIFRIAGVPQDVAARRMLDAAPVLRAIGFDLLLDPAMAAKVTATFRDDPSFQPVRSLCAAICPATADACATAHVAGFGHPAGRTPGAQPFAALMPPEDFHATPRGRLVTLQWLGGLVGDAPERSAFVNAARAIDTCLADAVTAAASKP